MGNSGYADELLSVITGASQVTALDVSQYQDAAIQHDLNLPVPANLHGTFDLLVDGGTLEHIFNVPVALLNYRNLVRPGGWVAICTPANNYMGHGFYQFSPELFFNHFSRENGFDLHYVGLAVHPFPSARLSARCSFHEVTSPTTVASRVALVSSSPALLLVLAQRRPERGGAETQSAIQSDYQLQHAAHGGKAVPAPRASLMRRLAASLPSGVANTLRGWKELRAHSLRNRRFYRRHDSHSFRGLPTPTD